MDAEILNIPGQVTDLLSRNKCPMMSTGGIGRKIFGYGFDSQHASYRKLLRVLNAMHDAGALFCITTPNNDNVWMLKARDLRVSAPSFASDYLDGELPF